MENVKGPYYQNQANYTESGNTCSANLPVSPAVCRDGRRNKSALRRRDISRTSIARFHTKYQKTDSCWLWQAGKYRRGYGMVNLGRDFQGRQHTDYAHRVAYVLAIGPIPEGSVVMHSCDTPACVNPAHLSLGTQGDNIRDGVRKGRYSFPHRRPSPQCRKLTDAQVAEIRASNEKGSRLSIRYGVSQNAISLIRRGLRRKAA